MYIVKQNKNNSRIFTTNFVDFQNFQKFNEDRILMETNIWNFEIGYKQTNRHPDRQAKFKYRRCRVRKSAFTCYPLMMALNSSLVNFFLSLFIRYTGVDLCHLKWIQDVILREQSSNLMNNEKSQIHQKPVLIDPSLI